MATKAQHISSATTGLSGATGPGSGDPSFVVAKALAFAELAASDTANQSSHVASAESLLSSVEGKSTTSHTLAVDIANCHALLAKVTS